MLFNLYFSKTPKNLHFEKTNEKTKKPHDANHDCSLSYKINFTIGGYIYT